MLSLPPKSVQRKSICVVRLTTSSWSSKRGVFLQKSLSYLRRKCDGYNILEEDTTYVGAEEVAHKVVNLYDVEDGIYEVVTCNESRCWETNTIDDYDYKLIPYEEDNNG